jgi:hypothetical protein
VKAHRLLMPRKNSESPHKLMEIQYNSTQVQLDVQPTSSSLPNSQTVESQLSVDDSTGAPVLTVLDSDVPTDDHNKGSILLPGEVQLLTSTNISIGSTLRSIGLPDPFPRNRNELAQLRTKLEQLEQSRERLLMSVITTQMRHFYKFEETDTLPPRRGDLRSHSQCPALRTELQVNRLQRTDLVNLINCIAQGTSEESFTKARRRCWQKVSAQAKEYDARAFSPRVYNSFLSSGQTRVKSRVQAERSSNSVYDWIDNNSPDQRLQRSSRGMDDIRHHDTSDHSGQLQSHKFPQSKETGASDSSSPVRTSEISEELRPEQNESENKSSTSGEYETARATDSGDDIQYLHTFPAENISATHLAKGSSTERAERITQCQHLILVRRAENSTSRVTRIEGTDYQTRMYYRHLFTMRDMTASETMPEYMETLKSLRMKAYPHETNDHVNANDVPFAHEHVRVRFIKGLSDARLRRKIENIHLSHRSILEGDQTLDHLLNFIAADQALRKNSQCPACIKFDTHEEDCPLKCRGTIETLRVTIVNSPRTYRRVEKIYPRPSKSKRKSDGSRSDRTSRSSDHQMGTATVFSSPLECDQQGTSPKRGTTAEERLSNATSHLKPQIELWQNDPQIFKHPIFKCPRRPESMPQPYDMFIPPTVKDLRCEKKSDDEIRIHDPSGLTYRSEAYDNVESINTWHRRLSRTHLAGSADVKPKTPSPELYALPQSTTLSDKIDRPQPRPIEKSKSWVKPKFKSKSTQHRRRKKPDLTPTVYSTLRPDRESEHPL